MKLIYGSLPTFLNRQYTVYTAQYALYSGLVSHFNIASDMQTECLKQIYPGRKEQDIIYLIDRHKTVARSEKNC